MVNSASRSYRRVATGARFISFTVTVKETDLFIAIDKEAYYSSLPAEVKRLVWRRRREIEAIGRPGVSPGVPHGRRFLRPQPGGWGRWRWPGSWRNCRGAASNFPEVIVWWRYIFKNVEPVKVGIFAGKSPLSKKVAILVEPGETPLGVCTSSATVGPALSLGRADAAVALSSSAALADAAATALANRVQDCTDLEEAIAFARCLEGLLGAVIICDDRLAAWGAVELCRP